MLAGRVAGAVTRSLTAVGPGVLVPAAWAVALGAHAGVLATRTLLVALVVMDLLLVAFAVTTRGEMTGPVLREWRAVLLAGLFFTLAGTADLALVPTVNPLAGLTLYAWLVLPGVAYLRTGRQVRSLGGVYLLAGSLSLAGAGLFAASGSAALASVGIATAGAAQTAGIVTAVLQNVGRLPS